MPRTTRTIMTMAATALFASSLAACSDLYDSFAARVEGQRLDGEGGRRGQCGIGRFERVLGEACQYVGEE